MPFLEIERAYKGYGPKWNRTEVLADINLEIERGEFVAIVGFSGSGKTTLMNLLSGLAKPDAGVVRFDEAFDVCFKVETHNHPSAIDPYGGANTGLGGVIRDPMGTGLGAKPICNTDVFCVAPPDTPPEALPPGVLHPRRVVRMQALGHEFRHVHLRQVRSAPEDRIGLRVFTAEAIVANVPFEHPHAGHLRGQLQAALADPQALH